MSLPLSRYISQLSTKIFDAVYSQQKWASLRDFVIACNGAASWLGVRTGPLLGGACSQPPSQNTVGYT